MYLWVLQLTLVLTMHKFINMEENIQALFLPPILVTIPIDILKKSGFPTRKQVLEGFLDMGIIPMGISTGRDSQYYLESKKEIEENNHIYLFTVFGVKYENLPEC